MPLYDAPRSGVLHRQSAGLNLKLDVTLQQFVRTDQNIDFPFATSARICVCSLALRKREII